MFAFTKLTENLLMGIGFLMMFVVSMPEILGEKAAFIISEPDN